MMNTQSVLRVIAYNWLLVAGVFLPVFLGVALTELWLQGAPPLEKSFGYHAAEMLMLYLLMLLPLSLGSLVHSLSQLVLASGWPKGKWWFSGLGLAVLVPGTPVLLEWSGWGVLGGGLLLRGMLVPTTIATIAYASCSSWLLVKVRRAAVD